MNFVDQVDLVAPPDGCIGNVFQQFARLVDLGPGSRIDLDEVDKTPLVDLAADAAFSTGFGGDALLAVERLGEDAGQRCLADAPRAGKQIGVVQPVVVQRVGESLHDMFLSHQFGKPVRTPFSREHLVGHLLKETICFMNLEVSRTSCTPAHESVATAAPFRA